MAQTTVTRDEWLRAGAALAALGGADAVGEQVVAGYAGGSAEALGREFGGLTGFLTALMAQGMDEVRGAVVAGTAELPPGTGRLAQGLELWLDGNLQRPWVRELTLRLAGEPAALRALRQRINGFILVLQVEFEQMGWPRAAMTARLASAAVIEIAAAEHEAGRALPELRDTLRAYFRH